MNEPTDRQDYFERSAMRKMAEQFHALATGAAQVPRQVVRTRYLDRIVDEEVVRFHELLVQGAGPLFSHFLASIPCVLEELARVGVALARHVEGSTRKGEVSSLYELDAFDGTLGRALATYARGRCQTLTNSPNRANELPFQRFADSALSTFCPVSFLHLDADLLRHRFGDRFAAGFDFIYEMAAFQFYARDRKEQIQRVLPLLRPGGLMFFLEKTNHPDPLEYERREIAKDELHKSHYFTAEEIAWKRTQMLEQMHHGQVTLDELVRAIRAHFSHAFLLWHSTNFYEIVASNDASRLEGFMGHLASPLMPDEFRFDTAPHPVRLL
jgi:SAM-dependent methyltransferase